MKGFSGFFLKRSILENRAFVILGASPGECDPDFDECPFEVDICGDEGNPFFADFGGECKNSFLVEEECAITQRISDLTHRSLVGGDVEPHDYGATRV